MKTYENIKSSNISLFKTSLFSQKIRTNQKKTGQSLSAAHHRRRRNTWSVRRMLHFVGKKTRLFVVLGAFCIFWGFGSHFRQRNNDPDILSLPAPTLRWSAKNKGRYLPPTKLQECPEERQGPCNANVFRSSLVNSKLETKELTSRPVLFGNA